MIVKYYWYNRILKEELSNEITAVNMSVFNSFAANRRRDIITRIETRQGMLESGTVLT